jgi:hypothetical protein
MVKKSRMMRLAQKYHIPQRVGLNFFDRESDGLRSSNGHSPAALLGIGTDQPPNQLGKSVVQLATVIAAEVRQQSVVGKQVADGDLIDIDHDPHEAIALPLTAASRAQG